MSKAKNVFRGLSVLSIFLLASSITAANLMEVYADPLDALLGTQSHTTVVETPEDGELTWTYLSQFKTAKEAYEGYKDFAIREAQETIALLKNDNAALPLAKTAKITMLGLRSYAACYGNNGGSTPDTQSIERNKGETSGNRIFETFARAGFQINPSMLSAYEKYCSALTWAPASFGSSSPSYKELNVTNDIAELSLSELKELNPSYDKEYNDYSDAAIVVVGRPGGESYNYVTGGQDTTSGNIMGLSSEEKEIIAEAKKNFDKVIVLINSSCVMEIPELKNDKDIDAVLWVGFPGSYGFNAVADVLNGTVSPSAHLGDTFVANHSVEPAMQSFGNIPWTNASDFEKKDNVNGYLVEAEGIYQGYRYYETRYADIVTGNGNAATASAGTYTNADGSLGTSNGTWTYDNEVVYPFGYGLSYTSFEQKLESVVISGDKKTATVTVSVKNTGDVAGKSVVQVYAQTPYTEYDRANGVEKSAIQLIDYEKTKLLSKNETQEITMKISLANLASYDYRNAKTYIVDPGDYYIAIGDDSHDALNNVLAAQGYTTENGMTADGDEDKTYKWTWTGDVDKDTFSVSKAGVSITNALSDGDYSMDLNTFMPGTVTYMSRSDWNGTFPKSYEGLSAEGRLAKLLKNDFIDVKTSDDTSDIKWGVDNGMTLSELKGADYDDPRWEKLLEQTTITEFLDFAKSAFHNIAAIPSVGMQQMGADDGPGGSDSHYFQEGTYQGEAYADAEEYAGFGTRVAPSPTNLAYSFNKELAYENGEIIIGETSLIMNLPIIIGPGGNLHRNGYNGRGGEYYSEDPILSGYTGSAVVQGAQSKGCLVNVKHAAFNDQEINRSGVAVFMNEQKARELELRNLAQLFEANGKPASFEKDESKADTYTQGAIGVMTSYNRIGAVASSANYGMMVQIMRDEWDFKGYNVTDFTGVAPKAAPKESILFGTTAFCGFGVSVDYWTEDFFQNDREMSLAIKEDLHYVLYSMVNSNAYNSSGNVVRVELPTIWRTGYKVAIGASAAIMALGVIGYVVFEILDKKKEAK